MRIQRGDVVRVVRITPEDATVAEHTSCWLGYTGEVSTDPQSGEAWVEFQEACAKHGATGAAFRLEERRGAHVVDRLCQSDRRRIDGRPRLPETALAGPGERLA